MNSDTLVGRHLVRHVALSAFDANIVGAYRRLTVEQRATLDDHERRLEEYLRAKGAASSSGTLRRLACLGPGAMRGLQDWLSCLDPDRGGFSARRLDEAAGCLQRIARPVSLVRQLPERRLAQLSEAAPSPPQQPLRGMSDEDLVVWLATLDDRRSKEDPGAANSALGRYENLSDEDVEAVIVFTFELLDVFPSAAGEVPSDILLPLALVRSSGLPGVHHALLDRSIYYPGELFRNADATVAARLLAQLESDAANRDHLLKALAWIGNDAVCTRFGEWRTAPPSWRPSLHVPPHEYSKEAGWTLDESGYRRDLFVTPCHALVARGDVPAGSPSQNPVDSLVPREDRCGWCQRPLLTLFDLHLGDGALAFLGLAGERFRIPFCIRCTCYAPTYFGVDLQGNAAWLTGQTRPSSLDPDDDYGGTPTPSTLRLGPARPTPFAGDWRVGDGGQSQLGGHPCWLQDAEYPDCPRCARPMPHLGQVAGGDVGHLGEGLTYAFLCRDCGVAATTYQQS